MDWTPIVVALIPVMGALATILINKTLKDQAAAETLGNAVKNSLGAIQNSIETGTTAAAVARQPGLTPELAVGVTYVQDHAGTEAKRLGISPEAVADKVSAQIGLAHLASLASGTTTTVKSLTPVAVTTTTTQGQPAP